MGRHDSQMNEGKFPMAMVKTHVCSKKSANA